MVKRDEYSGVGESRRSKRQIVDSGTRAKILESVVQG
jgi:hypothetical protein